MFPLTEMITYHNILGIIIGFFQTLEKLKKFS